MTTTPDPQPGPTSGAGASPEPLADQSASLLGKDALALDQRRGFTPRWSVLAAFGALALASVLLLASLVAGRWGTSEPGGLVFVIPAGAKASVARPGFDSAIPIPTDIRFGPDDVPVITVRNFDDITHRAGPFLVGPGQTYVQRFPEPGQYPIACSVDPLESIVVTVEA